MNYDEIVNGIAIIVQVESTDDGEYVATYNNDIYCWSSGGFTVSEALDSLVQQLSESTAFNRE